MSEYTSTDEVVTYAEAAKWLPRDIREHIETTAPCIGGGEHDWVCWSVDITTVESASTRTAEWWSCARTGCNLTVKTEPKGAQQ